MSKKPVNRFAGVLAAAAAAIMVAGCEEDSVGFDTSGWQAERGNATGANARGAMVATLDEAGVRVGASRDQIRAILGEPDSTGPRADIYFLGRSATGPSFDTYRIDYDAGGTVTRTAVIRN